MATKLDKKDLLILDILKEHGDLTVRQVSSRTQLPITTVHHRIKRMKSLGIIKRYTVELDHKKIGKGLAAYSLVKADAKYLKGFRRTQHDVVKELLKFDFIEKADIVTGSVDMVILIRARDVDELDDIIVKLRDTQGIESTETLVILHEN